jgi:TetR/AcrR family fatty acid metabolism transcriptional regulator
MINKRERIISAALKILKSGNYQNMSTAKIAKIAGVAEGTLYRYFKNKDDIFLEVIKETFELFYKGIFEGTKRELTLDENLNIITNNTFVMVEKKRSLYNVYYKAFSELENPEVKALLSKWVSNNLNSLKQIFIWAIENKEINLSEDNLNFVVRCLWGTAELVFKEGAVGVNKESVEVLLSNIVKIKNMISFFESNQ